jgi:hypothetical protein
MKSAGHSEMSRMLDTARLSGNSRVAGRTLCFRASEPILKSPIEALGETLPIFIS